MDDMQSGQMDPELVKQVLALQSNADDPQAIALARKQKLIDSMRGSATQPLEGQMVGRRYVAPSPLQGVANIIQGGMAGHQQQGVDQGMQDLSTQRQAGRGAYLTALTNAMRRPRVPNAVGQIPDGTGIGGADATGGENY